MVAVHQAFAGIFRHPSAPEGKAVHLLRHGIDPVHQLIGAGAQIHDHIRIHDTFHMLKARKVLYVIQLLLFPAVAVQQPQVEHIAFIHVPLTCGDHITLGHEQANKNGCTKGDDGHDGNIPAQTAADRLGQISAHCIFTHYHSISAIFLGFSLSFTDLMVPLRTWITRSAMSVRAPLWVMMMMVMPVLRPVSCSSCKMALPVW